MKGGKQREQELVSAQAKKRHMENTEERSSREIRSQLFLEQTVQICKAVTSKRKEDQSAVSKLMDEMHPGH